jgi:phage terminase large subunit-like protein
MQPWQIFIVASLFGWVRKDSGMRRFRKASLYIPRKNGKSIFGAGIGWRMFAFDNEPGAEVYSGATTLAQAMEVFRPAKQMGVKLRALREKAGVTVNAKSLVRQSDGSRFEPVIGKPGDGASPHCAIVDEYHEHQTSELKDTMETGMGARRQPMLLIISTAGANISGPCRSEWKHCEKLLSGAFEADDHFAIIFTIDDGDDWTTDAALIKANPNYDISIYGEFLRAQRDAAKRDARAQAAFKTKHLNMWVTAKAGMFNLQTWGTLVDESLTFDSMAGQRCFVGVDMAFRHDLAAVMLAFPQDGGRMVLLGRYYLPRSTLQLPQMQHYRSWERLGFIKEAGDNVIDTGVIIEDIQAWREKFQLEQIAYDPKHMLGTVNALVADGITCVDAYLGGRMPEYIRDFDADFRSGKLIHNGDPVLAWAIGNCVAKPASRGLVYLDKEGDDQKIDPVVSAVMAYSAAKRGEEAGCGGGISF